MASKKRGLSFFAWSCIIASSIAILAVVLYVLFKTKDEAFPVARFFWWFGGLIGGGALIGGVIYWFLHRAEDKDDKSTDLAKEYVGTDRALQIWVEECMKATGIPYVHQWWNKDEQGNVPLVPEREGVIEILNETRFTDPSGQTADEFLGFQANVHDGNEQGSQVAIIRVDLGEKYIQENWRARRRHHKTFNVFDMHNVKYPLTGSKNATERLIAQRIKLSAEGDYTEEELKMLFDPLIRASSGEKSTQYSYEQPIKGEELRDAFPQMTAPTEAPVDAEDIQSDINEYRSKRK